MSFSLLPRTVYKTKSKISAEIVVKEQLGQYTLHVQGMLQSGGVIKGAWKKALNKIGNWHSEGIPRSGQLEIGNCLVLGLGGGTVVQLIKARWPEAKIVGVEIDPEIVKIGKKFFGLDEIKNLEIITADALKTINNKQLTINNFDLIIVDLYLGDKFPKEAEGEEFLKNIRKLLSKNGIVIFNRLKTDKTERFRKELKKQFFHLDLVETPTNFLLLARS